MTHLAAHALHQPSQQSVNRQNVSVNQYEEVLHPGDQADMELMRNAAALLEGATERYYETLTLTMNPTDQAKKNQLLGEVKQTLEYVFRIATELNQWKGPSQEQNSCILFLGLMNFAEDVGMRGHLESLINQLPDPRISAG